MKATDYYAKTESRTSDHGHDACFGSDVMHPFDFIEGWVKREGKGGRFLDIGCQMGLLIRRLQSEFDECYGIDVGDYSKDWAKLPSAKFCLHDMDAAPLPFADNYFRVVSCVMVLEHVFDVYGLIGEAARVTQPGGLFMVEVPNIGYYKHILDLIRGRVPRTGAREFPFVREQGWDGQHIHNFTLKELSITFNDFGLEVVDHGSRGRWPGIRKIWPSMLYSSIILVGRAKK